MNLSETEHSDKKLLSGLWFVKLIVASSEEVKLCLQTFRMDFEFRRASTPQCLAINEYNDAVALKSDIAAANL